jgi:hypothetical protein
MPQDLRLKPIKTNYSNKTGRIELTMAFPVARLIDTREDSACGSSPVHHETSTMLSGQRQIRGQSSPGRFPPARIPRIRCLFSVFVVLGGMALAPNSSRADFIVETGASGAAVAGDSSLSVILFGETGCGSTPNREAPSDESARRRNSDHPSRPMALAAAAADGGGCSSPSSPTSGGPAGSLGLMSEKLAAVVPVCTGRIAVGAPLDVPSPMAARLLDPPRCLAQI